MKPWLWLPPQQAHDWAPFFVNSYAKLVSPKICEWNPLEWRGLKFPNRLGIAGGVDKDALACDSWIKLGAGFVEVGTVTPLPQSANPGPTVCRDINRLALWNKLGFPSRGADFVKQRLERSSRAAPLFVNIGKNRATPNEEAASDYARLAKVFTGVADALVINVSSPNTQGLRDLQQREALHQILRATTQARGTWPTPILLKLSPDISAQELEDIFDVSLSNNIDGWILTNTTRSRPAGINFPVEGGLSGSPLAEIAKELLRKASGILGSKKGDRLLVSVGGVMTAQDVQERLDMGADLAQVYSALIFSGPNFFGHVGSALGNRK
jgi:dihydroorotate dehydrogenase